MKKRGKGPDENKVLEGTGKGIPVDDGDEDFVIPVCFGELSRTDVEDFKDLWEKTWSSDSRFSRKSKVDGKD